MQKVFQNHPEKNGKNCFLGWTVNSRRIATVFRLVCFHFSNWVHEWILTFFEFWLRLLQKKKFFVGFFYYFRLSHSRCHGSNNKIGSVFNNFSIHLSSNIYPTEVKVHYLPSLRVEGKPWDVDGNVVTKKKLLFLRLTYTEREYFFAKDFCHAIPR